MGIGKNIVKIKDSLPSHVSLLAATKGRSVDEIKDAIGCGIYIIGENYVQEAA